MGTITSLHSLEQSLPHLCLGCFPALLQQCCCWMLSLHQTYNKHQTNKKKTQTKKNQTIMSIKWRAVIQYFLSMVTWGHSRDLTAGCKAVEWWVITMQHYRVNRVSLLKFKQQLLHGLNGVVTAQIDHYFLDLETYRKHRLIRPECLTLRSLVLHNVS